MSKWNLSNGCPAGMESDSENSEDDCCLLTNYYDEKRHIPVNRNSTNVVAEEEHKTQHLKDTGNNEDEQVGYLFWYLISIVVKVCVSCVFKN